jgi:hypothetical protein
MQLTFSKSKFDVAEGQYLARFNGTELLEPKPGEAPRMGQDGKPMAPGMAWRFEIVEGENTGKIADRVTGRLPGPKNLCGRFLAAISGQILKDGMTVDLQQFVGKLYRINVVQKERSDGTCVSDMGLVRAYDAESARSGAARPAQAAGPKPPAPPAPPPTHAQKLPDPADDTRWQWHDGAAWHSGTAVEFRVWMGEAKKRADEVFAAPAGTQDSKLASDHGFEIIPF